MVFLPSTRKGSFRLEMSNHAWLVGVWLLLGLHVFSEHAGAVGDDAVDHGDVGAVDDPFEVIGQRDVLRHEDVCGDARGRGVGSEARRHCPRWERQGAGGRSASPW